MKVLRADGVENEEMSPDFDVTSGTKQGCVLAPLLFIICIMFFATVMLSGEAFQGCEAGIRTDGDVLDSR